MIDPSLTFRAPLDPTIDLSLTFRALVDPMIGPSLTFRALFDCLCPFVLLLCTWRFSHGS